LGEISNFGDPQQRRELSDRFPRGKLVLSDEVMQMEDSGLDDCFELPPDERSGILHDIVGADGVV
jgi:hypothetical protein